MMVKQSDAFHSGDGFLIPPYDAVLRAGLCFAVLTGYGELSNECT